jgi:hypothetical protein
VQHQGAARLAICSRHNQWCQRQRTGAGESVPYSLQIHGGGRQTCTQTGPLACVETRAAESE